jgi:hypothetical protein
VYTVHWRVKKEKEGVVHTTFWQPENGSMVLAIATIDKENQSYQHLIWFADRKVFVTQGKKQKNIYFYS